MGNSLLSKLSPVAGSTHYRKRLGRGKGTGLGQTSGKGHKGQLARTGGRVRRGFEGGQSPLVRRLPKVGFNNVGFKISTFTVGSSQLAKFDGIVGDTEFQVLGAKSGQRVKVILSGKLEKPIHVKAYKFSEGARNAIESIGGKIEVVD